MTSKLIVNTIESDSGISTITFNDDILVSGGTRISSTSISGVSTIGVTTAYITNANITNLNNGPLSGTRNIVINGAMDINQRGWTGAAGTTTNGGYGVDRFYSSYSHDGVVSAGQTGMGTTTGGNAYADGFQNALILRVTTADASLGANQYQYIAQAVEGFNVQGIKKGTVNALPVTLSFWCRSTTTGTYIVELEDSDNNFRQVSQAYTINTANTWEKKVLTFPADTIGTLNNDNNRSLRINWWLASGPTYSSGTLNTSWATITQANRAVGQTNLLATAGNNFWLTGVQLEVGSVATPFERRSYGQELALCQRYYEASVVTTYSGGTTATAAYILSGWFKVPKRIAAYTCSSAGVTAFRSFNNAAVTGYDTNQSTVDSICIFNTAAGSGGDSYFVQRVNISAEL